MCKVFMLHEMEWQERKVTTRKTRAAQRIAKMVAAIAQQPATASQKAIS